MQLSLERSLERRRHGFIHRTHPGSVAHCQSERLYPAGGGKATRKGRFLFLPSLPAKRPYISPASNNLCLQASGRGKLTRKGPLVTSAPLSLALSLYSVVPSSGCLYERGTRRTHSLTHFVEQDVGVPGLKLQAGEAAGAERRGAALNLTFKN